MTKARLRVVADENLPGLDSWLSSDRFTLVRIPGREITRRDLQSADILLVRSVTAVNQTLLEGSSVGFVGSATIGIDHVDLEYLQARNITFSYAPGCNARAVIEWLLAIFAQMHLKYGVCWWQKTIGIVGVGTIGRQLYQLLRTLGCDVLVCDPYQARAGTLPDHINLQQLLSQSDIVSLHTPLSRDGSWPTEKFIGKRELEAMKPNSWLINASRGSVIDNDGLSSLLATLNINLVLDVWPSEPCIPLALLNKVAFGSPHVAGYSLQGKLNGSWMLMKALFHWLGEDIKLAAPVDSIDVLNVRPFFQKDIYHWASHIISAVYNPNVDLLSLRRSVKNEQVSKKAFDQIRKSYSIRKEFSSISIMHGSQELNLWLKKLGFEQFI